MMSSLPRRLTAGETTLPKNLPEIHTFWLANRADIKKEMAGKALLQAKNP